jgi:26S proteasome non-ATPase regulatory subunit 9
MSKASETKEVLKGLVKNKQEMEEAMETFAYKLEKSGGTSGSLVDHDGYPRRDVDVHDTLIERNKLNCMRTDYKDLLKRIEDTMYHMHAQARDEGLVEEEKKTLKTPKVEEKPKIMENLNPFLIVNSVASRSPAETAGLKPSDEIIRFADITEVEMRSFGLKIVGDFTANHQNKKITVVVQRIREQVALELTPQVWEGKGLLGCHLLPINK